MEKRDFKRPRFTLDRSRRGNLAGQIAAGLRTAIETGYYRPGDILPPVRDLAQILGVSMGIAVQAVNRIREAGLISPRPAIGSVVCAKDRPLWKGQVLIVVPSGIGNPGDNAVYSVLRDTLTAKGYLPLSVTVRRFPDGTFDFSLLGAMMRQQTDLVVQLHDKDDIAKYLSHCNIPFIRFSTGLTAPENCIGIIRRRDDLALADFVGHCSARGVKSVLQVAANTSGPDAVPSLRETGIHVENWCISPPDGGRDAIGLVQSATDAFVKRFAGKGRSGLPDLIFFRDDHLAVGALLSLTAAGIRIPEDVSVVTWANAGLGPAFVKPLTRMEQDNSAIGEKVAECVLDYLRTGVFPKGVVVGPKYVRGESF